MTRPVEEQRAGYFWQCVSSDRKIGQPPASLSEIVRGETSPEVPGDREGLK